MKKRKTFLTLMLVIALVGTMVAGPLVKRSQAAALVNAYMLLSDIDAGLTTGVTYVFALQPSQSFTTPTLTIDFPVADNTDWCATAGTLTATGVSSSAGDANGTGHEIDLVLPGTFTSSCTQGNGTTTGDQITVTGITALTNSNVYGISFVGNTGALGTSSNGSHLVTVSITEGANIDTMTFGVQLLTDPDVVVSATVTAAATVTCSLSSNTVALGALYAGGAYVTGNHTITAQTSTNAEGYYWAVYGQGDGSSDAGLYKSIATTDLLASTGSTTINLNTTEGFGMTVTAASGATVETDFQTGTPGVFGALDRAYAGAQMLTYQQGSAETSGDTPTVTYGAKAGPAAEAGSYQETVTFLCGGYY